MTLTRNSPLPIRRQLRKEAGFGCCLCGHPFLEYHHILPYADGPHHDPEHMMALCPNHHHEANIEAISESDQRRAKASPHNISVGLVEGQVKIPTRHLAVSVGSNEFVGDGFKLQVDDTPLLELHEDAKGRLQVSLDLFDDSDVLLASISRNEWISGDPMPWDMEFGHKWLKLRAKKRKISLSIDGRDNTLSLTGAMWRKSQCFAFDEESLIFNGVDINVGIKHLALVALSIRANTSDGKLHFVPDERFGAGSFVSWPDPDERVEKAIMVYEKLRRRQQST